MKIVKLFIILIAASFAVYLYIHKQNEALTLRLQVPEAEKQLKELISKGESMQYEIDQFESPKNLLDLSKKPEYSHLKYPHLSDVIVIERDKE